MVSPLNPVERAVIQSVNPIQSRLLSAQAANGIRYAYRSFGSIDSDPLVLLSWFRANLDMWDQRLIENLTTRRRVIVIDNAGVGLSGGMAACTVEEMAQHVCAFVDAIGLSKIDLLGFSLGGYVAQQITIDRPDLVRRLILTGTAPRATGPDLALYGRVHQVTIKERIGHKDLFFLFFAPSREGRRRGLEYLRNLPTGGEPADAPVSKTAWLAQIQAANSWGEHKQPSAAWADQIGCPTLVAHGQFDVMVSPEKGRLLAELIPQATFKLFPDCGHAFLFEAVEEFAADLLHFLK